MAGPEARQARKKLVFQSFFALARLLLLIHHRMAQPIRWDTRQMWSNRRLAAAVVAITAGLAVAGIAKPAAADVITYGLDTSNGGFPGSGPYGTVSVDLFNGLNTNEALITFTSNASGGYYFHGNNSVGVNSNGTATISNITGNSAGTYSNGGSGNEDGFGSFSNTVSTTDGFTDKSSTISFDLTLSSGTWADAAAVLTDNSKNYLAAAAVGQCSPASCTSFNFGTGYVANGPAIPTPAPEPASLALLGSGLLGLGLVRRWRRKA